MANKSSGGAPTRPIRRKAACPNRAGGLGPLQFPIPCHLEPGQPPPPHTARRAGSAPTVCGLLADLGWPWPLAGPCRAGPGARRPPAADPSRMDDSGLTASRAQYLPTCPAVHCRPAAATRRATAVYAFFCRRLCMSHDTHGSAQLRSGLAAGPCIRMQVEGSQRRIRYNHAHRRAVSCEVAAGPAAGRMQAHRSMRSCCVPWAFSPTAAGPRVTPPVFGAYMPSREARRTAWRGSTPWGGGRVPQAHAWTHPSWAR